jgi:succinate dehydrogenase hydrophobic anchor subunit
MNKKFIIIGVGAGFTLLVLYFGLLSLLNSFSHAISEFSRMWYWVLLLAAGFGLQVGLYTFIRDVIRQKQMKGATGAVVASGTLSTGSMIACCLHHLTDVLPLLGLAAATIFLLKYQTLFILTGVLSNLIGITIMLEIIQRNNLGGGLLKKFLVGDMSKIKKIVIVLSLVLALITFLFIAKNKTGDTTSNDVAKNLPAITNEQAGISFTATPLDFSFNELGKFEIKIDTHTGSLDFDLTKISVLEDENGNQYQPLDWQGSLPGGHHREGILTFAQLKKPAKSIKLIIQDVSAPRIFEWDLE